MWYKEGAGEFFAQYIEFFAEERAYWLGWTIITFIGTINRLISFCITKQQIYFFGVWLALNMFMEFM